MGFSLNSRVCGAVAVGALLFTGMASARADVKLVAKQTVSGGLLPQGASDSTVTTYYKGDKVRTEAGPFVTIYDCAGDKFYTLDPAKKTYTLSSLKAAQQRGAEASRFANFKTNVNLKPGGKTRTIAGKRTTNYIWDANISITPTKETLKNAPKADRNASFRLTMSGETWATEGIKVSASCQRLNEAAMMGGAGSVAGLRPLVQKLGSIKGVTLLSDMTQNVIPSGVSGSDGKQARPIKMEVSSRVTSISEAPLPASLFSVPAGYKKVSSLAPPRATRVPSGKGG